MGKIGIFQESAEILEEIHFASDWDVALRYHEIKTRIKDPETRQTVANISSRAILDRARKVLGSMIHPRRTEFSPWDQIPADAEQIELDLETTLENHLPPREPEIWMRYELPKPHPVVLCVDTSLSMTGEKLALTAVALAVVLLQFPRDPIGIVAFETEALEIKKPREMISIQEMVKRFLDVPGRGYTHLEDGLKSALEMSRKMNPMEGQPDAATILLTDGKYTAGKDPGFLGARFEKLFVLKMGDDHSSLDLCRELARKGKGRMSEVQDLKDLPQAMFLTVKELVRG